MADIGIDLGTTYSAAAHLQNEPKVIDNQGRQTTPSAVAWDEGEMLVGHAAKDMAMVLPSVLSWKRDMGTNKTYDLGGQKYTPVQLSAMILRQLKTAAEERLSEPVDSVVITIPAYFGGAQSQHTMDAAKEAGMKDVRLLSEPIAAALAYGAEDKVLVYDLGGGTFDVAIIDCFDFKMLGLDGDNYLGGDDFDNRLMSHLAKEVKKQFKVDLESSPEAKQRAKSECERVKRELSERDYSRIVFQTVINGVMVNLTMKISRGEFEQLIMDLIDKTIERVEGAIAKANEKTKESGGTFTKDDVETVLLVGGSTYIPLVQRKVKEFFGKEPSKKVHPDLAVALGAAVHTASGSIEKGVHRIKIDPMPLETAETKCTVKGRTSPGAKIDIRGGATTASGVADDSGRFNLKIELTPNTTNNIAVTAISSAGVERKGGFQVRHDASFEGEEQKGRRKTIGLTPLTPRTLGIRVTGEDDRLGVIIPDQTEIPCHIQNRDYVVTASAPNQPGRAMLDIFEGDLPFAPFNTRLASLTLETPGSPSTQPEPVEITFQITEDRLLTVTARMVNFPDRMVKADIKLESVSDANLNLVERADRYLNVYATKMRPEDKVKLSKTKVALSDLSDQYRRDPSKDRYDKIKETGNQLRADLDRIEAACR